MIDDDDAPRAPPATPIVLHLVHGTWPRGFPLGGRSKPGAEWFDDGSEFQTTLAEMMGGGDIRFRSFLWSGRNSFDARQDAARELANHLEAETKAAPDARQAIIAHSHGGTVAALALSRCFHYPKLPPIGALVCLGTPFAHRMPASDDQGLRLATASAALILSMVCTALVLRGMALTVSIWWLLSMPFLFFTVLTLAIRSLGGRSADRTDFSVRPQVAVFALRSTRDEATLALGLAQAIHAIMHALYALFDDVIDLRSPLRSVVGVTLLMSFGGLGLAIATLGETTYAQLGPIRSTVLAVEIGSGFPALAILLGQATLGLTTGLPMRRWLHEVTEVDVAPFDTPTMLRTYDFVETPKGLRHGVYHNPRVLLDLAALVDRVRRDEPLHLLTDEELTDRHERRLHMAAIAARNAR
jgi:pimeloyl-ACP methyl ester carboxylesterase